MNNTRLEVSLSKWRFNISPMKSLITVNPGASTDYINKGDEYD